MPFTSTILIKIFQFFCGWAGVKSKKRRNEFQFSCSVLRSFSHWENYESFFSPAEYCVKSQGIRGAIALCGIQSNRGKVYSKLCIGKREMNPLPFPRMYCNIIDTYNKIINKHKIFR